MPAVLTATAMDDWNWKIKDSSKSELEGNLTLISTMTNT